MEDIILCEGTKEDYIECGNASRKSDKWIVCPEDYDAYVALIGIDKMHHVVAKTKEGEYVGSCLCLEMDDLAMMALYYVRPEFRHKAVGSRIFRKALSTELANAKNIGLHSTPQMSKVYDSALGFNKYANWRSDILAMHNIDISKLSPLDSKLSVRDVNEVDFEKLVMYDATVNKAIRRKFIEKFIVNRPDALSMVVFDNDDNIVGYGSVRTSSAERLSLFCPLYCDSDAVLVELFRILAGTTGTNSGTLFAPSVKTESLFSLLKVAAHIVKKMQCTPQFTQYVPEHHIEKIYGLSDLNLWI